MTRTPWSISHKFILLVSAAVALFMISAFLVTRSMLEEFALSSADEAAELILDQTDRRLVSFFTELEDLSRGIAGTAIVREADVPRMGDLFLSVVKARGRYLRAVYLGTSGGAMHEWGIGEGFVADKPVFPAGYDPRTRPWYREAMSKGDFVISPPYRYASVDDIGITCAVPVIGRDGLLAGVLGMDILLRNLGTVLEGLKIPKGSRAFILDSGGMTICSQFDGDGPTLVIQHRLATGEGTRLSSTIDGRETLFAYRHIATLGWTVVVAMPLGIIRGSVRELLDLIGFAELLLMAALVVALAWISGRLIVAPLGHIVSVMNKAENGDRTVRVKVSSGDEFGFLGVEFNRLLETAIEYSTGLEDKVRQRTEELLTLQRENTRLKVMEERRRIYRDMHDTIGAKLTNIFFSNGVARELAKDGDERLREKLESVEANCLEAVKSLKGIILGMVEDERRSSSFALSLSVGMRDRLENRGISLDCSIRNRRALEALPRGIQEELEKLVDELVSNVLKHADAGSVRFRLSLSGQRIALRFSDDGAGWDPASVGEGAGLGNIRYRVGRLGGELRVETAPGAGSSYRIDLPLPPAQVQGAGL